MRATRWAVWAALAAGTALGSAALAQGAVLEPREQNGVTYVTGGVGTEEQDALKALTQEGYNLELLFAERGTGAYLANVHVLVTDAGGRTVLDTRVDGPALLAKLPNGRYDVVADYHGVRQERTVNVGRGTRLAMEWAPEVGSAPVPADQRAPHGDAPPLAGGHAGEAAAPPR